MDSFTFELAEEVRDVDRKRRAAYNHAKHFKQLAHRRLKSSKELIKRSNELDELNIDLNDEAGSLIKDLSSQEQILKIYCLDILQSQSFSRELKRKWLLEKRVVTQSGRVGWYCSYVSNSLLVFLQEQFL